MALLKLASSVTMATITTGMPVQMVLEAPAKMLLAVMGGCKLELKPAMMVIT